MALSRKKKETFSAVYLRSIDSSTLCELMQRNERLALSQYFLIRCRKDKEKCSYTGAREKVPQITTAGHSFIIKVDDGAGSVIRTVEEQPRGAMSSSLFLSPTLIFRFSF